MASNAKPITVVDAIHAGIVLGLGQKKTLEIWRALGGEARDIDFAEQWRKELEAFKEWRREALHS